MALFLFLLDTGILLKRDNVALCILDLCLKNLLAQFTRRLCVSYCRLCLFSKCFQVFADLFLSLFKNI
jgi:hypothetical protein